jgi:hypothetical protein
VLAASTTFGNPVLAVRMMAERGLNTLILSMAVKGGLHLLEKVATEYDKERRVELTEDGVGFLSELVSTIRCKQAPV